MAISKKLVAKPKSKLLAAQAALKVANVVHDKLSKKHDKKVNAAKAAHDKLVVARDKALTASLVKVEKAEAIVAKHTFCVLD